MKTKIFFLTCIVCSLLGFVACSDDDKASLNLSGDCLVEKVGLDEYEGIIDHTAHTITVTVPEAYNTSAMKVTNLKLSNGETCNIHEGDILNMGAAIVLHIVNGDVFMDWTLIARNYKPAIKPAALFVGSAYSKEELDMEAQTACNWMLANVPNAFYASFGDIADGTADLSECKLIWWHWHDDGVVDGHDGFLAKGTDALNVKNQLKAFYENGGSMLLTRYATHLPTFIGVTGDDEWTVPNNCFGDPEMSSFKCDGPWAFDIYPEQAGHPIWNNLVNDGFAGKVPCTDSGYFVSNSVAQYPSVGTDGQISLHGRQEPVASSLVYQNPIPTIPSLHGNILLLVIKAVSSASDMVVMTGIHTSLPQATLSTTIRTLRLLPKTQLIT